MGTEADRALKEAEERGVRFVRLWFTDVLGFLKSFAIPVEELEKGFREGIGFDGSAVDGFARVEESDVLARPDPRTFRVLPWPEDEPVARMLCDITHPDGTPFEGDPRHVLRRMLGRAAEMGFRVQAAPEVEYFVSRSADRFEPLDQGGYFDLTTAEVPDELRTRTVAGLEQLGIAVHMLHHEDAPSQHEIDLVPAEALDVADAVMAVRLVVKEAAQELGLHASFMPKPAAGIQGSGMHTHLSLWEGERNALFDPTADSRLSKVGRSFVAGLLEHAPAITAVTNQWVNSYKRLVPGFEAPVHVCWARRNRSALVRVPADRPDEERACRIEYRAPDPACNPYLALAVIVAAGLDGVSRDLEPPAEATENLNELSDDERRAAGIASLPDTLLDAVHRMERSELVADALGEHVFEWFIRNKREEWGLHRTHVTPLEIERSFPIL
ncbi:MAG TPA: glutamine synthetase family protein [Actinomycetota bacterium]|nr:glutamine synthetase family protein [Actinomycetota bacterium]